MKSLYLSILLILVCRPCFSYQRMGSRDCGSWVVDQRVPNSWPAIADTSYLQGVLNTLNETFTNGKLHPKVDPLSKLHSINQAILFVDNFCQSHPLSDIDDAAMSLFYDNLVNQ